MKKTKVKKYSEKYNSYADRVISVHNARQSTKKRKAKSKENGNALIKQLLYWFISRSLLPVRSENVENSFTVCLYALSIRIVSTIAKAYCNKYGKDRKIVNELMIGVSNLCDSKVFVFGKEPNALLNSNVMMEYIQEGTLQLQYALIKCFNLYGYADIEKHFTSEFVYTNVNQIISNQMYERYKTVFPFDEKIKKYKDKDGKLQTYKYYTLSENKNAEMQPLSDIEKYEIQRYCDVFSLSPRETEILLSLVERLPLNQYANNNSIASATAYYYRDKAIQKIQENKTLLKSFIIAFSENDKILKERLDKVNSL